MKYLVCTHSLEGLFTAVYESYYTHKDAKDIVCAPRRTMLDDYIDVAPDKTKFDKVRGAILAKGGRGFYAEIERAFRSGHTTKCTVIANYLRLFFKVGKSILNRYGDAEVVAFQDIVRKVSHETERIRAFTRLMEMKNGVYYGHFTSDNDVLDYVGEEIRARLNTQAFVLHDVTRGKLCLYDGQRTHYNAAPEYIEVVLSEREMLFQTLWTDYHKNVSIKERENPRLQRGFLPKKYRKFMVEFTRKR